MNHSLLYANHSMSRDLATEQMDFYDVYITYNIKDIEDSGLLE
jgi:NADPH-dependent 7-cyano-7-deazaguanine reductase QueF